jgi:uncharacterized integral membrane protein (TIGR00698 family)
MKRMWFHGVKNHAPGLLLVTLITVVSIWMAAFIGKDLLGFAKSPISAVMVAMLVGLLLGNLTNLPKAFDAGIKFSVKRVLRMGIVLLGVRLSLVEMLSVIRTGLPVVLVCVVVGLVLPHVLNRWLKLPRELVSLISVGTSICGVSAIVATSESLGARKEHTAYAIATITLFGLLATVLYPVVAWFVFKGDSYAAGMFFGTAIHDTSQVAGAAFLYQDYFSDPAVVKIATVAKLIRNTLMVVVIPGVTIYSMRMRQSEAQGEGPVGEKLSLARMVPFFIVWFVLMSVVRSVGDQLFVVKRLELGAFTSAQWKGLIDLGLEVSSFCITMALAGVGLGTSVSVFRGLGFRPLALGFFTAVSVGLTAVGMLFLLGL